MSYRCKDGHESDDPDYCSVCGTAIAPSAPIAAAASAPAFAAPAPASGAGSTGGCPACGEPRTDPSARFCEVCRYDFVSGSPGPPPVAEAPAPPVAADPPLASDPPAAGPPVPAAPAAAPAPPAQQTDSQPAVVADGLRCWEVVLAVDPSLDGDPDPDFPVPTGEPERVFPLDLAENLIGRRDDRREIFPEIPVRDPGVSRRHAKLLLHGDSTITVLDLASTNGTKVNGRDLVAGVPELVRAGDAVQVGRWTSILLRAGSMSAPALPTAAASAAHPKPQRDVVPVGSTPWRLTAGMIGVWAAALLLLLCALWIVSGKRYAIRSLGTDSAPSVVAALEIRAYLSDLDANAANALIEDPRHPGTALKDFETRRIAIADRMVDAAQNITYGDAEKGPVQTLSESLGAYLVKISEAETLNRREHANAKAAYLQAESMMETTLLPAADRLAAVNWEHLVADYNQEKAASSRSLTLLLYIGLLVVGVLGWLQWFLFQRTNRLLNPALLAATLVGVLFIVMVSNSMSAATGHLKVAKEDAFNSMKALWQARALGYDANGDESRYLLDFGRAQIFDREFTEKVRKLADSGPDTLMAFNAGGKAPFHGYFADELNNITFEGEGQAALEMVHTYGKYLQIDAEIRRLQKTGHHWDALALDTGSDPGQSDWAFAQYDGAIQKTIDINQKEFERNLHLSQADLGGYDFFSPAAAILIAVLAWLGLRKRLAEYALD